MLLDEVIGVISRPKFHNIIVRETAEKLIETIKTQSILVKPSQSFDVIKEDPDDNIFLEAAVEAKANFIISQDIHLTSLKIFRLFFTTEAAIAEFATRGMFSRCKFREKFFTAEPTCASVDTAKIP